jgi:plasmid maintenance system killer protein
MEIAYKDAGLLAPLREETGQPEELRLRLRQRLSEFVAAASLADLRLHGPAKIRVHGSNGSSEFSSRLTDQHRLVFRPLPREGSDTPAVNESWDRITAIELLAITPHES